MTKSFAILPIFTALASAQLDPFPGEITTDPVTVRPLPGKMAYCQMEHDATFPTTYPYGLFRLYQEDPSAGVRITGWMKQMPPPASAHGFHINYKAYPGNGEDCHYSTIPRWDGQSSPIMTGPAGPMNSPLSQIGNLDMVIDDILGNASYNVLAERPTLYNLAGPMDKTIIGRSMVLYKNEDDMGSVDFDGFNWFQWNLSYYYGSNHQAIACCNIKPIRVLDEAEPFYNHTKHRRILKDEDGVEVELLTREEYKKIFGVEFDLADWTSEGFTQ